MSGKLNDPPQETGPVLNSAGVTGDLLRLRNGGVSDTPSRCGRRLVPSRSGRNDQATTWSFLLPDLVERPSRRRQEKSHDIRTTRREREPIATTDPGPQISVTVEETWLPALIIATPMADGPSAIRSPRLRPKCFRLFGREPDTHRGGAVIAFVYRTAHPLEVDDTASAQAISDGVRVKEARILIVDDEPTIVKWVGAILRSEGYEVVSAPDARVGLRRFEEYAPNLVLLDVMLPNVDGYEVLAQLRESSTVPIIMLSARSDERDKVRCLRLGADDYLVKPFGIDELVARVEAALRRSETWVPSADRPDFTTGELRLDFRSRQVTVTGREVHLTPIEYKLLVHFIQHQGRVLTHQNLLGLVWGPRFRDEKHYLRVYVNRLRHALGRDPTSPQYIETIPGVGYRFTGSD